MTVPRNRAPDYQDDDRPRWAKSTKSPKGIVIGLFVVVGLLLIAATIGVVLFFGRTGAEESQLLMGKWESADGGGETLEFTEDTPFAVTCD